ncbi:MAG: class I SAM-dependent methyltransferase [Lachnospiraceae bacterium]|nr:class I SAM-dependent methyltransferase [Lachnospiraceae bacterium]
MDKTLNYYENNAASFAEGTVKVDFTETQDIFLSYLPQKAYILDFGCGSGRDTKCFLEKGYKVDAIDGSSELCKLASRNTGIDVRQMYFQDLDSEQAYDGIWACASILHLQREELKDVLKRMIRAVKKEGYIYMSFKYGEFEGYRGDRYFTDFTEESFIEFLGKIAVNIDVKTSETMIKDFGIDSSQVLDGEGIAISKIWKTHDARPGREDEKWLNVIVKKI